MIYVVKYIFLICYINTLFLRRVLFCYSYNLSQHFSLYNNSKFVLFKRNKKRNKINKYHNIYYHKGGFHYENNIGNNNISNPFFLNKFIYNKKKHKLNFFNSPTSSYDDACILKNLFNSFTTEGRIKNKKSDKNVKMNVMIKKKCMLYLTFNRKENDNIINNNNNDNNKNNNNNNNNNDNNYHVDESYLSNIGEPCILLRSTSWGHLSLFYGSHLNRDYYTYEDIIKYIETNEKKFVKCINNNIYNNNDNNNTDITKQTFIDKKYILIRGRMERKKKQSKRIFLYLRLSNGMYLTCVYEKKIPTNKNNQSIYSIDNMYTYIKNLKNESVIDVVGRIKLHGTLYKHNISYIESLLNQTVIELVAEQINCISESFYNPPFMINDNDVHTNKIQMVIRGDNNKIGEKNNVDKTKNIPYNNLHAQQTNNNYEEEKKINTNENLLKVQNFCLNYRNSINHLIFYIKSKVFQRFRNLLERDGYTEIFTSKFIKIKESEKNPSVDKSEKNPSVDKSEKNPSVDKSEKNPSVDKSEKNPSVDKSEKNYEETQDNNLENTSSSDNNINAQLTGSEGGCRCYKLEGQNIVLSQSPQLFKQMLINSDFDKVYEINYCYRNEKFHSSRHLNEFMSLDIEKVIYDNYYEIIIYMYNILKDMNTYINNNYFNELNILSSFYNNNNNYTYRASQFCDNPIVISFSEAQDILDKYYRNNKNDILLLQKKENNIHINNKNTYIYDKKYNKYIKILNNEEKQNMKKKIMFESSQKDKLHNIYYYNKILKYYKINKQENKQKKKNLFICSPHDMDKQYNEANIYNDAYYHFLNTFNKDEFYRKILLFFNNMYDKYDMEKKKLQENNTNVLKTQTQIIDGSNIYRKVTYDGNDDDNNNHDEHIKTLYDLINIINKKETNNDNINNNDDGNNNNNDDDGNVFITEPLSYNNLKNKYILYDDFTNDELNYLYLFIKNNFQSDIFIIDQYPIFLRPYYTGSNMYDLRFSNSYDFIYKGMEIISGSQRIHNLPILLFKTLKENKQISLSTYLHKKDNFTILNYLDNFQKLINKKSTIYKYFNSFQYASKPHGGLALGMERYLITLLNLNNVKNVTFSE
ncbi:hypothetical protein PFAG_01001 [Plasmodium falciparum Santa Lucia]|uniref:aspartate--tRNA ligase n=1 Tax=Plasmodium falciparum Santa Lucia TaxID=478859 RepID=W7FND2_PLAFA|nr:hypothetical protein PFAG_01001 [Plasmodium falciparum Santa Lucia]